MTNLPPDPFADSRRAEETFRLEPAPEWVDRVEVQWTTPTAPDDHVVCLLAHTQWAPERFVRYERSVRRLVSREAVQKLAQIELDWDPEVETLIIHVVSIWREGVQRSLADRSRFLLRQREGSFEQQLVHGRMSALILLDDVRMGDAVELEFSILSQARLPGEKFDAIYASERTVTTGEWIVSIRLPVDSPFEWKGSTAAVTMSESPPDDQGEIVRTFSGKQDSPLLLEVGIPPWLIPYEHFQITGYHSWSEVAQCIAEAWAGVPRDKEALRQFAEEISRDAVTPEDKAYAIIDWVQEQVRYLGMVGGAGGLRPQSPNLVLERRYGDCKDKTLLLCCLLNEIGIDAEPVLVNTVQRHMVGSVLPGMGCFDHVIASFRLGDREGFVDGTAAGDGGGIFDRCLLPYGLGLPVRSDATRLIEIPDRSPELTSLLVMEDFHLAPSDAISYVDWRIEAVGSDANLLRARFRGVGGETFAKVEAEDLRQSFPTARHLGPAKWIDDKSANRVIVWGRSAFADWGTNPSNGKKTLQYKPRWIYHALTAPSQAERREHPFQLIFPTVVRHEIRVHQKRHGLSENLRLKSDNPFFETSTTIKKLSESTIEAVYAYRIRVGILNPDQVDSYWEHLNHAITNQLGLTLLLKGKAQTNRSLPDNVESMLPARDEDEVTLPRVDLVGKNNVEEWLVKPGATKSSPLQGTPPWAIALGIVFILGSLGNMVERCSKESSRSRRSASPPPTSLTVLAETNLAYVAWEKEFFDHAFPQTFQALRELTRLAPQDHRTFYAAAVTSLGEGETAEASRYLDAITASSDLFARATTIRGHIAVLEGDHTRASHIARQAIEMTPEDPMAWSLASQVASMDRNHEKAAEFIRKAVALAPEKFLFRKNEVFLLATFPDQKAAFDAATRAENDFPKHTIFTDWIADYYGRTGQLDKGIEIARGAVERSEDKRRSRIVLARLLAKSPKAEDQSESTAIKEELIRLAGENPDRFKALIGFADSVGELEFTTDLLTRAALSAPRADLLVKLAQIRIAEDKPDEARIHLELAQKLDPGSPDVKRVSWLLQDLNLNENILDWGRKALQE